MCEVFLQGKTELTLPPNPNPTNIKSTGSVMLPNLRSSSSNIAEPSWRGLGTGACTGSGQSIKPQLKIVSPTPSLHSSHSKGSKRENPGVTCLYTTLGVQSSPPMPASPRGS